MLSSIDESLESRKSFSEPIKRMGTGVCTSVSTLKDSNKSTLETKHELLNFQASNDYER